MQLVLFISVTRSMKISQADTAEVKVQDLERVNGFRPPSMKKLSAASPHLQTLEHTDC